MTATATEMFCYQCEQAAKGTGCTAHGVCGKEPVAADLQDLLVHMTKRIGQYAHRLRALGQPTGEADLFVAKALFATVTNVNFDADRLDGLLEEAGRIVGSVRQQYVEASSKAGREPVEICADACQLPATRDQRLKLAEPFRINKRRERLGPDVTSLQELLLYGLKGMASYAYHAAELGRQSDDVWAFFHEALDFLEGPDATDPEKLTGMVLRCGEVNLAVMGLLDEANTGTYGHPEPTEVRITPVAGKCIVVSGHDLQHLENLLKQTEGKGINVYTHGEMLPCHAYPGLKKYDHLVGNYGGAWQDQQKEFEAFPGAILMTTNCIQKPSDRYNDRIFTSGPTAWPGVTHIADGEYTPVIEKALAEDGFTEDAEEKTITVGFGRHAVLGVAEPVIEAVKSGAIRHFFLVGGCDGARSGRNYYTEFAQAVPDDCVILTLACGKYRFNKLPFGDIGGIPRLLDIGQCNDAYSAVQIAVALADAFECGVNELPLSLILSWYEQKAVVILLSLLHLGIKDIRIGPSLPAFVSEGVLQELVDTFDLKPISTPEEDLAAILGT